jgi:molecular chaperone GrpE
MEEQDLTNAEIVVDEPVEEEREPSLDEQLAAANARADENHNKYLLALADLENHKRRTRRDIDSMVNARRRSILERFLPVLDNLERALKFESSSDALREGLEQTLRGFEAALRHEGVREIEIEGRPFDPRLAEAIGTTHAGEGVDDETVAEVAQKGYTLGDELLRPAKVIVAKKSG